MTGSAAPTRPRFLKSPSRRARAPAQVEWPSDTLPWIVVSFKGPAYSDESKDMPTADIISNLFFSESSALYQKLVIQEQKVDALSPQFSRPPGSVPAFGPCAREGSQGCCRMFRNRF